jgi:tripartite-type tricarboxylate transporter receptor subunit TctC
VPARLASEIIKTKLGQAAVVENRPGSGGAIGARAGAAAPPDGYTLFLGNTSTFAVIPAVSRSAGYDPVKDFMPIIRITEGFQIWSCIPFALADGQGSSTTKANRQDQLRTPGAGAPHLASELFMRAAA